MTEKRQFCPRGHDTFEIGRDASYRCLACKREAGKAARDARLAEKEEQRWAADQRRIEEWRKLCREHLKATGVRLPGHID